ncbi:UDP-N-acetylmuramoyl-L-alanine--D-glutamate ligase [Fretibacter rubidus]|uniref:UDP-N-acetylmuramoyl-L-alanine--D-glutamate ligase n=1 Tax=Fretibacter rubidus TaxID=570162 RepID=UPI00352A1AE3
MIKAATFKGQDVAVFGLGRTGLTAAKSLAAGGARVHAWDDRDAAREQAASEGVTLTDLTKADWSDFSALVLSPGVPHKLPKPHWTAQRAEASDTPIICDIEIFAREIAARAPDNRPKIIAITGTNGKSTTTTLIGHILERCNRAVQIGGNIGRGVLDLDRMHAGMIYVLELSSYQLERAPSLHADVAVFLNLSPDHLDRHGDMAGYEAAKLNIFNNQTDKDTAVIGVDDPTGKRVCTMMKAKNGRRIVPISGRKSLAHGATVIKGKLYCAVGRSVTEVADLTRAQTLEGTHNWQNAAAAYAAVQALGLKAKEIGPAILSFPGLAHRMESVGMVGPVRYVNDSKATNGDAARQALAAYENIYWIAGGVAKKGGIEGLSDLFSNVTRAYLIGEAGEAFAKTLKTNKVSCKVSDYLETAIICATKDALASKKPNPIILLSPACASFDQFKDFESRGDVFRSKSGDIIALFQREINAAQLKSKSNDTSAA